VKPQIGDMVIYRNQHAVDMPAVVTALAAEDGQYVHLHTFPSPGVSPGAIDHRFVSTVVTAAQARSITDAEQLARIRTEAIDHPAAVEPHVCRGNARRRLRRAPPSPAS